MRKHKNDWKYLMQDLMLIMFKTLSTFIAIYFFQTPINAELNKLFSGKNGSVFYVDFETLTKNEQIRSVTIVIDFLNPKENGDLSRSIEREINCQEFMYRDLNVNFFSSNLGQGVLLRGSGLINNPKWNYSPPGSSSGEIIKIICMIDF